MEDVGYKPRWSEDEIPELLSHAREVLETDIPLSCDISKTVDYLKACRFINRDERDRMILVADIRTEIRYRIRFMPYRCSQRTEELAIPEDVLACAYNSVHRILDNKCDFLAKVCGYRKAGRKEE